MLWPVGRFVARRGLQKPEWALQVLQVLQALVVDYAVHHGKASGGTSARVFKGWTLQLPAHGLCC